MTTLTPLDVIILFFTIFAAVTISATFLARTVLQKAYRKAGYNFMRGRSEYMDKREEEYKRKRV